MVRVDTNHGIGISLTLTSFPRRREPRLLSEANLKALYNSISIPNQVGNGESKELILMVRVHTNHGIGI
ncbi:hypothetical protein [Pedobacter sp. Leaf176]|uniref:hypothetical protein n=1 Tax=Pedobacter sp. Leaf176 TaxID=1736286 RepID=UPI000A80596F|nr:hypothetical protein [Pedobacter sp. Leaf176]